VALSRARLGLYVFCRRSLFELCLELAPAFKRLLLKTVEQPVGESQLQLVPGEGWPATRLEYPPPPAPYSVQVSLLRIFLRNAVHFCVMYSVVVYMHVCITCFII
jgi:hypothetical protein